MKLAIIPARGGSKRIPGKNVKMFGGKPMIAHSIVAARETGIFDQIIVTTDDDQIADIARDFGATTPFRRPAELSDDRTTTDAVLLHALDWMDKHAMPVDYACCIYATAPFVRPQDLRLGLDKLRQHDATTAFSVTTFPYPIFRALGINAQGRLEMLWPENRVTRSQDLPEAWHDAGQFYWMDVSKYQQERRLFSTDSVPVPIPRYLVQDIDSLEDWQTAERMFLAHLESR